MRGASGFEQNGLTPGSNAAIFGQSGEEFSSRALPPHPHTGKRPSARNPSVAVFRLSGRNVVITSKVVRCLSTALLVACAILKTVQPVAAAPQEFDPLTVGAVIGGAYLAKGLVDDMLDDATDEVKDVLSEVDEMLNDLIDELGATYEDLLDVTLDQLDEFTQSQLLRIHSLVQQIQADLQVGLDNLNQTILEDLRFITTQVRTTLAQVEDIVAVAVGGALIVVDKTAFNLAFLIVIVILAVGLLAFTWLLFTRRLPPDVTSRRLALVGMGVFILVFGALLLPQGRAYAFTWSGMGRRVEQLVEPQIFQVIPDTLIIGRTQEVVLLGARLAPDGEPPSVQIAGAAVPVTAAADELVALDVRDVDWSGFTGTQTIRLQTTLLNENESQVATGTIAIQEARPLPSVISWTITPIGSVYERGGNVTKTDVGCRSTGGSRTTTGSCHEEIEIRVDTVNGYVLDPTRPATIGTLPGSGDVLPNPGNNAATYGFKETITTYESRDPGRRIEFLDEGQEIVGIVVVASARSDTRHPITNAARNRGEFRGTYTVYGRRINTNAHGAEWTFTGSCPISGTVICGTYPYPEELAEFVEGVRFLVQVTFRGADGEVVAATETLTPNVATPLISAPLRYENEDGLMVSATYELRILDLSVQVFGPDLGVVLPPIVADQINEALDRRGRCPMLFCP